jgi:hypothetical protein
MVYGVIGALLALVVWYAMHRKTRRLEAELSGARARPHQPRLEEPAEEPRKSVVDVTDEEIDSAGAEGRVLRRARDETKRFWREAEELRVQLKNARLDLRDALEKLDEYEDRYGPLPGGEEE